MTTTEDPAVISDYRLMRRYLFALTIGGALLVVLGVQLAGQWLNHQLLEEGYAELQQQLGKSYRQDIHSVVRQMESRLGNLLHTEPLIALVRAGDREALQAEMQGRYQRLRRENPYLEVLHFHGPDNRTLLRLHRPEQYGDDLTDVRPMIADANRRRQTLAGFEIGKNSSSYRVAVPINDGEEHLGVLEIGIDIRYFTERLSEMFAVQAIPLFHAYAMETYLQEHGESRLQRVNEAALALQPLAGELAMAAQRSVHADSDYVPFNYRGGHYVAYRVFGIDNYQGEAVGKLMVLADVSQSMGQIRRYTLWSGTGFLLLLGLLFIAQYVIFSRMQGTIHYLAFYDLLTGLPNRSLLLERIRQALRTSRRNGQYLALLFIDLDNFKPLNDTHGHHAGDELLRQLAKRLRASVRDSDTVARQGGDEFVMLLEGLGSERVDAIMQAHALGDKLAAVLNPPYLLEGGLEYQCPPSIGMSVGLGSETDIDELLRQADQAMYRAKDGCCGSACLYQDDLQHGE